VAVKVTLWPYEEGFTLDLSTVVLSGNMPAALAAVANPPTVSVTAKALAMAPRTNPRSRFLLLTLVLLGSRYPDVFHVIPKPTLSPLDPASLHDDRGEN
jgi:hypothetical protein